MYVRLKTSKKAKHPTLQIVEGIRKGKKVLQRTVASLGVIKNQKDLVKFWKLAENLIEKLKQQGMSIENKVRISALKHKATVYDGFGQVVDLLMRMAEFSDVLKNAQGKKRFDVEEAIKLIIVQRLHLPSSKRRTWLRQEEHGFQNLDLQHIYRSMDALAPFSTEIQKKAFEMVCKLSPSPIDCFFFDVTTLYFESIVQDDIRDFGFSKDQKYHMVQIVLALVVDSQGMPLAYEVFEGNLAETKTLIPVLESLKKRFSIANVTVVCDRGLASKTNVKALQDGNFHFVIATKLRSMSRKLKINELSTYSPLSNQEDIDEDDRVLYRTMNHPQYENTLLIVTYSPSRAFKDKEDRERLLKKLRSKLSVKSEATVKQLINNNGLKKFTDVKDGSQVMLNEEAVAEDATWDGFHGIAVSNSAKLTVEQALARYKDLWRVEETFRIAKCTLKTRPIFHWTPIRIRSHVLLCFMTLFLERLLEILLRKNNTPLTPDKIRHALSGVHTTYFEEEGSSLQGKMMSTISKDAQSIFRALKLPLERSTLSSACCA